MLKKIFFAAALAAALVTPHAVATAAAPQASATYAACTANFGLLTINTAPAAQFLVLGQQADGRYMPLLNGMVPGTGTTTVGVSHHGPTSDGMPQYIIQVNYPDGTSAIVIPAGGDDLDRWWLD